MKEKKSWSAKKILLTFLLIGIVLGVALSAYLIIDQSTYFNPEHDCVAGATCHFCDNVEEYGNVYNYIFSFIKDEPLNWLGFILWFPLGAECIATLILVIRKIKMNKGNKKETKEHKEKITNAVNNVLD